MKEEIVNIIADVLEVDVCDIEMDTAIGDLPEWDSIHHLQIIAELENVYNIKFNAADLAELEDVSDLLSLVEEMREA
ncbi:MAG: acyl carrier protein [Bacteroides sp.]|jgi:acyl carrier protein|uniref:acyl carrier protein n=1 Tax=Phocaeicola sartorii TaxID=671267 RepID=UPI001B183485|nr:acyl carrier protein [Phocaeicola sartorii]MBO5506509.1 acyl carrier protein [Bacteroides sp.]